MYALLLEPHGELEHKWRGLRSALHGEELLLSGGRSRIMLPKLVFSCEEKLCLQQTVMEDDTTATACTMHNGPHSEAGLDV